ncbi:MAG: lysophospholipase [Parvibaculum sp.]|uniref:alpha/beta hydrolase n=1 Tax=Parvibaculum sp. TaxID=2024848 RepID=UPI00271A65C4|nr:alpha/beta hydrolase [Parvibaculum sp.]MDO8838368.1 lysophospholipase [Parvibaculum sp.]
MLRFFAVFLFILAAPACAPRQMTVGDAAFAPRLEHGSSVTAAVMTDGARLPVLSFEPENPRAVMIGLHGFNDYANAFAEPGPGAWFAERGVAFYAYDQRGFGRAPGHGRWAGDQHMAQDLAVVVSLVRQRHSGMPVYLLGESMGGAVAMRAMTLPEAPAVDGLILAAPAVWGWQTMNPFYAAVLRVAAHTVPSGRLTGRGLDIWPSDNIEMLRALADDPQVIKETRIDAVYGLVGLMDRAYEASGNLGVPVLLLYGVRDELVPSGPTAAVLDAMRGGGVPVTALCYPDGWHMLLRDLQRETVWGDIAAWIEGEELPSSRRDLRPCGAFAQD